MTSGKTIVRFTHGLSQNVLGHYFAILELAHLEADLMHVCQLLEDLIGGLHAVPFAR